jgi:fatty acid synthase
LTPHFLQFYPGTKRPVWFVFTGMGSQWPGMGKSLIKIPVFAAAIEKCHQVLEPHGVDLMNIITSENAKIFDNVLSCVVCIAACQVIVTVWVGFKYQLTFRNRASYI